MRSLIRTCLLVLLVFLQTGLLEAQTTPANGTVQKTQKPQSSEDAVTPRSVSSLPKGQLPGNTKKKKEEPPNTIDEPLGEIPTPSIITQGVALSIMSMLPFIIMILTSFLKIVIVLSLLRSALGVQQSPPNQIINGIAFMLSLFVMYPTALKMYDAAQSTIYQSYVPPSFFTPESPKYIIEVASAAGEPMREFLKRNSSVKHQGLFFGMAYKIIPEEYRPTLKPDDYIILVPSYITSQLKDAFEIGVLIYIPFFVIDLVTSNILLAMGMMMLSPVTISMPLKLFLLVMLDGWTLLIEGLVSTFRY